MEIYFCLSYLSVPHIITLIRNNDTSNFRIVTSNKQLYIFFCELFNEEVLIFIPSFSYTISFSKEIILLPIKLMWIWRMKQKTWKIFKEYKQKKVYFFFNAAAYSQAWLIYKLSKNNKVLFKEDIDLSTYPIKKGIKERIAKIFIKLIYRLETYPIDLGEGLISYKLSAEYFKKINSISLKLNLDYKDIANWVNDLLELPSGDILMLTNYMPEFGLSIEDYVKASDNLIEQLKLHNYNVHIKLHSRGLVKNSFEKDLYEVPKYLPASLLINYKVFIGYVSSALPEAANIDIVAISLIDCFPSGNKKSEYYKIFMKKNLKKNKIIYFPKSLNELLEILK